MRQCRYQTDIIFDFISDTNNNVRTCVNHYSIVWLVGVGGGGDGWIGLEIINTTARFYFNKQSNTLA